MPAGGSASEEARRLRERAEKKRREADRLEADAQHWEQGAEGERRIADVLDRLPADFFVFHDLQLPESSANVDHLIVGPTGIWVIDTKHFKNPLTKGSGKGADRLWTGRSPIKTGTTAWEAAVVSDLIGYPVEAVMCIISPSLPQSSFEWDGLHVCSPARLSSELQRGVGSLAPEQAARVVAEVFGVAPAERVPQPEASLRSPGRSTRAVPPSGSPQRARTVARAIVRVLSSPLGKIALLVAGFMIFVQLIPAISGAATSVFQRAIPEIDSPPVDTEPYPVPPGVRYSFQCSTQGEGWVLQWEWPGDLPDGVAAYGVRAETVQGEESFNDRVFLWSSPDKGTPRSVRVDQFELITILTDYRVVGGRVVATTRSPYEGPVGTC